MPEAPMSSPFKKSRRRMPGLPEAPVRALVRSFLLFIRGSSRLRWRHAGYCDVTRNGGPLKTYPWAALVIVATVQCGGEVTVTADSSKGPAGGAGGGGADPGG